MHVMEKEMETHSSTLAWKIPWMIASMGYQPGGRKEWDMTEVTSFHFISLYVRGICNFLRSVSVQQKFEATDGPVLQLRVTVQYYLESKEKYILETWGWADPKDAKRREAPGPLAPHFICFSPPPEPALCKL